MADIEEDTVTKYRKRKQNSVIKEKAKREPFRDSLYTVSRGRIEEKKRSFQIWDMKRKRPLRSRFPNWVCLPSAAIGRFIEIRNS